MGALFYIIDEEKIYQGSRKDCYNENVLELLSLILRDVPKSLSLDAFKSGLKLRWERPYDIIIPYGDIRHNRFETTWRFDPVHDQLVFDKNEGQSGQLALSLLRQCAFTFDDFESCKSIRAPIYDLSTVFPTPYWEPVLHVSQRKVAFTHRVLTDFNFQWRHILRHQYNDLLSKRWRTRLLRSQCLTSLLKSPLSLDKGLEEP